MATVNRRVLPGFSLTLGYTVFYLSVLVLIPIAACFLKAGTLSFDEFWARGLDRAGAGRLPAHLRRLVRRGGRQRGPRPARRLGAGALRVPGQAAGRLAGRPAARAADRGGGPRLRQPVRRERLARAVPGAARASRAPTRGWASCWCWSSSACRSWCARCSRCSRTSTPEAEEAAASLGATRWQTFRRVILPPLYPALITGFALAFARVARRVRLGRLRLRATCRTRPRSRPS